MTSRPRVIASAMVMWIAMSEGACPQASPPATTMPTDADLQAGLDALLVELHRHELDPGIDGIQQVDAREKAIRLAIQRYADDVRKMTKDDALINALPRDLVSMRNAASPRLSGRVLRVGEGGDFKDLASVVPGMQAGDLIVLDEGVFELATSRSAPKWTDVALVGKGVNRTTLKIPRGASIRECSRLLISGVRVDCLGDPLMSNNQGSGFMLKDCELMNYNSGSGGSNAIYSGDGVAWIEGCLFDGAEGVSGGRGSFGSALDIRGDAIVIARRSQFVDNGRIDAGNEVVFLDRCTMLNQNRQRGQGVIARSDQYWLRESDSMIEQSYGGPVQRFVHATDDVEFVDFVLDPSKPIDDDSRQLAELLQLQRRLPYWIGLIHHDDARIRAAAAKKVQELTGEEVRLPAEQPRDGESLADAGVLLEIEKEYARLMNWFDANRAKLSWDDAAGRYRIVNKPAERSN